MTLNEVILIALNDAQDNGDLFFHSDCEEDDKARELLEQEIQRLSKLVYSEESNNPSKLYFRGSYPVSPNMKLIDFLIEQNFEPSVEQAIHDIELGIYTINRSVVKDVDFQFTDGTYVLWIGTSEYDIIVQKKVN